VLNVSEQELQNATDIENKFAGEIGLKTGQIIAISARTEEQLSDLSEADAKDYLNELGLSQSGLERVIKKAFSTLGLITFLTAGEKEVRAWTIKRETRAQDAAGAIHNDFVKNFIKADVVNFDDFIALNGWKACREQVKVRSEGRDYIVEDGDVVEFKIGQ
jgi:hypothetical protein